MLLDTTKIFPVVQTTISESKTSVPAIVYISDLPIDKPDTNLEQVIHSRLEVGYRIQISKVECFSKLGIAVINLVKQEDKDYLVNNLQRIVLYPNDNITVTCTEQLEVTSYILLDKNTTVPTIDAIARRWSDLSSSTDRPKFKNLSAQFPNIIQVTSFSIEAIQAITKFGVFQIEGQIAKVYTHVDCSYLEELPHLQPKLDENRIFCFIATQLNMNERARMDKDLCQKQAYDLLQQIQSLHQPMKELKSQVYIQYNEQSSNAIILASNCLHKWVSMKFVNINGQLIFKTANISTKLIIKSIPPDFPLRLIFDHAVFRKSIREDVYKLIGEHLVVEINDKLIYEQCLKVGAFEVINNSDRLMLRILPFTILDDPDNSEINIENWYGTRMQNHKPDITQFDSRHPIFRYKWNSKLWLDQFMQNKKELEQRIDKDERRQNDFIRRMLRVTVMLNTMAVMRMRKYILEDSATKTEVSIEPPSPLVTILYNKKSKLARVGQTFTPPFNSTTVDVLNEDCLVSYHTLSTSYMKPLLLNMANSTTPGGGYRKGDGAQEENLFRRSNYYMSLDPNMDQELDQSINTERNYCSNTGEVVRLSDHQSLYPIDEYGAIYTSGITVFRNTEDQGYSLLNRPLYDVCAVAIAAYRDPQVLKNKQRLVPNIAVATRKKIESLFAIAYRNGHHSLVLSAFGCGAFKNPPEHIALIFKSVILQYAGYFKKIVFSIIDDHNTGQRLNPNGNFLPFQQILDKFVAYPPAVQTIGMSLGPFRVIQSSTKNQNTKIEEFITFNVPPCEQAAYCQKMNDQHHCQSCSHPPICPLGSECTENDDDVHCQMFIHRKQCSDKGQCILTDCRHLADFDHPEYCPDGSNCVNMRTDHLNLYRHLPICDDGLNCDLKFRRVAQHLAQFRHCQRSCKFGGHCILFHDQKHISDEQHPFNPPCPYTPFSCKFHANFVQTNNPKNQNAMNEITKHCYRYSHICPWGRLCTDQSEEHLSTTIHIARQMCPNGNDSCNRMKEEDHLDSFSHKNVRDIRVLCHYPGSECRDRGKIEHNIKYRHNYMLNYLGVTPFFGLNKNIHFIENQINMIRMIRDYVEKTYKQTWTKVSVPRDLLEWIAALQPIHRCAGPIFESILVLGHVMSRFYMERLKDPTFVADTIDQHKRVRTILASQVPALQKTARDFITALVRMEFNKGKGDDDQGRQNISGTLEYLIHSKEQTLKPHLSQSDLDEIRLCASEIAQASIKLHSNMTGIGHKGDEDFETHQQVFSILGPHFAQYYGDIVIIFKRDVMLHPDSNFTMQAATMYKEKTFKCRPWLSDSGSEAGRIKQFHSTKLHCSIPGYAYVTALELMAITGTQRKTMNVDLSSILHRWKQIDGHQVIEAHLPQLIPLSYIEHIYMPKNVFESLSPEAQKNAQELFQHNLTVTNYEVDLKINPMAFSKPDDSRKEYENYVMDQILRSIRRQQERNSFLSTSHLLTSYGMTITISATHFENLITNPLTITQSYNQYLNQSDKTSTGDGNIYIYWKALRGDFMLILTNEMIETGKVQPKLVYLTCYIAPFVTIVDSDINYNEYHTYINPSSPAAHKIVLEGQHFKAGSNKFHKGCNSNDYILYCLKLNLKKRQVSLMNAGINGIYNHTILKYTFEENELDLASLDYIHLSAGRETVSIRNLVISHEMIPDAHPKFDKEFLNHINDTHAKSTTDSIMQSENVSSEWTDIDATSEENENNDKHWTISHMIPQPIKHLVSKYWPRHGDQSEEEEEKDSDESKENQQIEHLTPCKYSIYCLDQYSPEKSLSHNQTYSHPCRFSELCRNIRDVPHSIQFTHSKNDVSLCKQDEHCSLVIDPVHRCSCRHSNLPDYLVPCRDQQKCHNSTIAHRKKYFHGEKVKRPIVIQNIPKETSQTKSNSYSKISQNLSQQDHFHSSPAQNTTEKIKFHDQLHTDHSSYLSNEKSSHIWSLEDEESDDEDLVTSFYNDAAGKSNITDASGYDQYGNPIGRTYDLGRDGAFSEFSILIAQFYIDSQFNDAAMKVPIDALKVKGFQVKHVKTENECITEITSNHHQIAWIISTNQIQNPAFVSALIQYHSSGGAIFLFADNTPYVCHASEFLKTKFGITVEGNYYGNKTMTYKENGHQQTGNFGQHEIFTGIANLFEGITICHPIYSTAESRTKFTTLATATDGNSSIAVYDPPSTSTEGRLCLDCGFTKLYINWDSAGTARYIVNASCWLLGIEKRLKQKKKSKTKK
ncbi:unnamed protein product [Rotaria sp. Silwood2]|nr:unnamed protein product [Rotaria sp. Silwood2]